MTSTALICWQALIWRHKEFVLRYNAECDAAHPKSTAEIIREIEAEERLRNAATLSALPAPAAPPARSTAGVAIGASADPLASANAAYGTLVEAYQRRTATACTP